MILLINGEQQQFEDGLTAAMLVERLGLKGQRIAMEINEEILPRSQFGDYSFKSNDRVEIIHAVGGG